MTLAPATASSLWDFKPLDPEPFICSGFRTDSEYCCGPGPAHFNPRPQYEQNKEAYTSE